MLDNYEACLHLARYQISKTVAFHQLKLQQIVVYLPNPNLFLLRAAWPDWAEFRLFGQLLKVFGGLTFLPKCSTYIGNFLAAFSKFLLLNLPNIDHINSHLVTLALSINKHYAKFTTLARIVWPLIWQESVTHFNEGQTPEICSYWHPVIGNCFRT